MANKKYNFKPNAFVVVIFVIIALFAVVYLLNKSLPDNNLNLTTKSMTDRNTYSFIDDDTVMGNPKAPILIVEFGDFMCKFCGEVHREIEPLWRKEYIETGKVRYVFRDFISVDHPQAFPAAEASECAGAQGKQWQMYDMLFDNAYKNDTWAKIEDKERLLNVFKKYGKETWLNMEQFSSCMSNNYFGSEIQKDINAGIVAGVSGTPTIFIGNDKTGFVKIVGSQPYAVYKQVIDEKLNAG